MIPPSHWLYNTKPVRENRERKAKQCLEDFKKSSIIYALLDKEKAQ